ncbi:4'-phosphopantetheinyl transferase superfamily protein [Pedobacter sp. BMA]|uniref:4'-phosphopantetheinyl transferase family protein n=1 Tax=Pedobacter sp. BMA TaxID=1663685 RepID=UPI00069EF703|nr:4'-phosphopantetheinyl transferase superfamily protein [Pedobacter sp. BMA]
MLGNDVVDLKLARRRNNWRRANYLSKIFTPDEQRLVYHSDCPDLMVWLIWSMKEAAYKIVNRNTGLRFFDPKGFHCTVQIHDLKATGCVDYRGEQFMTHSEINEHYVHTLSFKTGSGIEQCHVVQRRNADDYVLSFNLKHKGLMLQKNNSGLPEIFIRKTQSRHLASVSHHGRFLFIAYLHTTEEVVS